MPLLRKSTLQGIPLPSAQGSYPYITKNAGTVLREQASASLTEKFDVFLSHSYADAKTIEAEDLLRIKVILERLSLKVYIDWVVDGNLSRDNVTPATAAVLRARMNCCRSLLYVTSENASKSRWMPWELGYFDGMNGRAAIFPIDDGVSEKEKYHGQEYLGLYPYITYSPNTAGVPQLWVEKNDGTYVGLKEWIGGRDPYSH